MLNKLINFARDRALSLFAIPAAVISGSTFLTLLIGSLQDGVIDTAEALELLESASGAETVLLVIMMLLLKKK